MATSPGKTNLIVQGPTRNGGAQRFRPGPKSLQSQACSEEEFRALLILERRRAERSRNPFVLMLLDARQSGIAGAREFLLNIASALGSSIRETDGVGWYLDGEILGAIFTELGEHEIASIKEILRAKVRRQLEGLLPGDAAAKIVISLHVFPQEWDPNNKEWAADAGLYPDLYAAAPKKSASRIAKRAIDVISSAVLLTLLSPILGVVAAAVKLTSKGPVLFRQERMGHLGKRFGVLKFRSMYVNNASSIHQNYVREFIAGSKAAQQSDSSAGRVYKIVNDPRVTPLGRFLRRTSLDELPQLWNVLVGEMSLVGPRPPVPYEYAVYEQWHRRRVLEVRPGITGLWQVNGRSRTTFDEMVRMDLQYATNWSLWLDLKILLMTPMAVFSGAGAH